MKRQNLAAALVVAGLGGILTWSEAVHWRSSGRQLGERNLSAPRTEAVVVLGFRNAGRRANYINRYRVRAGLRSLDPEAESSLLILCGGTVRGEVPEADLMARYARDVCGYRGPLLLDRESRTTWENICNVIPLLESVDSVKIVSNSLHAEKGRAYLWMMRPDIARRLRRGSEHRFGELALVKPVAAVLGSRSLARMRVA